MQEIKFYEYAVIRVVPRVEREEFFNVGIILFSKNEKYLKTQINFDEQKLNKFNHELNPNDLFANLRAFHRICEGNDSNHLIATEDLASRFRWLTAQRSSSIQTSRPHVGSTHDLDKTLQRLFCELVL